MKLQSFNEIKWLNRIVSNIEGASAGNEEIIFTFSDGQRIRMFHYIDLAIKLYGFKPKTSAKKKSVEVK